MSPILKHSFGTSGFSSIFWTEKYRLSRNQDLISHFIQHANELQSSETPSKSLDQKKKRKSKFRNEKMNTTVVSTIANTIGK